MECCVYNDSGELSLEDIKALLIVWHTYVTKIVQPNLLQKKMLEPNTTRLCLKSNQSARLDEMNLWLGSIGVEVTECQVPDSLTLDLL